MARKYSKASQKKVEKVMRERKAGTLRSGSSGKKVTSVSDDQTKLLGGSVDLKVSRGRANMVAQLPVLG